jgi:hypothetical protein
LCELRPAGAGRSTPARAQAGAPRSAWRWRTAPTLAGCASWSRMSRGTRTTRSPGAWPRAWASRARRCASTARPSMVRRGALRAGGFVRACRGGSGWLRGREDGAHWAGHACAFLSEFCALLGARRGGLRPPCASAARPESDAGRRRPVCARRRGAHGQEGGAARRRRSSAERRAAPAVQRSVGRPAVRPSLQRQAPRPEQRTGR